MEENETIVKMFSRFQTLASSLNALEKWNFTVDHVKKILRSLASKLWLKVTTTQKAKDLNKQILEELLSLLRSHEIELIKDELEKKSMGISPIKSIRKGSISRNK